MSLPNVKVVITYTNHRGETGERRIAPRWIWFGASDWHPEEQWLLHALDIDKGEPRDFALKDIHSWRPVIASSPTSEADARKAFVAGVTAHMRPEPLDTIDDRTPEQLRADGDDRWPDGTPYTPSLAHAAPDLLTACKALLAATSCELDDPEAPLWSQIRAAVEKATGGAE